MIDDIRYLIVFAKVVEVGSLSGGAEVLGLTPATVSQHLSKLEKNLGSALLYRNTRKLSLTQDGATLLETAKAMLELYEKGVIEFKRGVSTESSLRISMPAALVGSVFMARVAEFIQGHPTVRMEILCSDSREDIIAEGIDVAFRVGDLSDSTLKAKHLFALSRTVVASKAFLERYSRIGHPRDLEQMPWIGLTMRPSSRIFRSADGEQCEIRYQPRITVDSIEASYHLARGHVGLAAPPQFRVREDLQRGVLEEVLPAWSLDPLKVYAVWPPNVATSSMAYALINAIYRAFEADQRA
jgi:DNA-binding transcriptional LysR family regulator